MIIWLRNIVLPMVFLLPFSVDGQQNPIDQTTSQVNQRKLDRKKWKEIKGKIRYRKAPGSSSEEFDWETDGDGESHGGGEHGSGSSGSGQGSKGSSSSGGSSGSGISNMVAYIGIVILVLIVAFLIARMIMARQPKNAKVGADEEEEHHERPPTEIPKSELELSLEKALANDDYREAVRIYFIFIIKDLTEKGWIRWEKEKTNMNYLSEMSARSEFTLFSEVTRIFEFVWYGERQITRADFESVEGKFRNMLDKLNNSNKQ